MVDTEKSSEQYHVCITSVDKDDDIKDRIYQELERRGMKCYYDHPGATELGNMHDSAMCCMKKLLLISKAWIDNNYNAAHRSVMHIRERCKGDEHISLVYVAINVTMDELPTDLQHEIETTRQQLLQYENTPHFWDLLVCSIKRKARVCDDAPSGDVAYGMCWSYFYGYLNIVLKELKNGLKKWRDEETDIPAHTRVVEKLFVICPEQHENGDVVMLGDMAGIEELMEHKIPISQPRAGTFRHYDLFMYQLTDSNGEKFCVPMVMNWNLVGITSMVGDECFHMTHEQMKFQNLIFLHKLQNVLESKKMDHHVRLIQVKGSMMKDKSDTSLAEKLVEECEEALKDPPAQHTDG